MMKLIKIDETSKRGKKSAKRWAKREANKDTAKAAQAKFHNMSDTEFEDWKENQKEKSRMAQRPSWMR